jgi:multidrug efflux pump subunit AcrA (membrane-fusion protein)
MIRTLRDEKAIVIGKEYVFQNDEQNVVYTVAENQSGNKIARIQPVTLGASYKNDVVIASGLQAGEELITVGSSFLQDNMRIKIVNQGTKIAQGN